MSDQFENEFANVEEDAVEAEVVTEEAVVEGAVIASVDEDENDDDDFFTESAAAAIPEVDPATVVTIRTSQGSDVYVAAPEPMPLVDAVAKSGIRFNGDYTCWLNGQEVGLGTTVSGGMVVTVVGSVKGGA